MKSTSLNQLRSPTRGGKLKITDTILPIVTSANEIIEGTLTCDDTNRSYPIIMSIPILDDDWHNILADTDFAIRQIVPNQSPELNALLNNIPRYVYGRGRQETWTTSFGVDVYIQNQYSDRIHKFYRDIPLLLSELADNCDGIIEYGANTSGIISRALSRYPEKHGYAVDLSLSALICAASIHGRFNNTYFNLPFFENSFECSYQHKSVKTSPIEFICADVNKFQICGSNYVHAAINLIDITNNPINTVNSIMNACNTGDQFVISTPYYWRIDRSSPRNWLSDLESDANSFENSVKDRAEIILNRRMEWEIVFYPRYKQVWNVDLLVGIKR